MADWRVKGRYVEACNCEAVCPCIVFSPPTEGQCTALLGWHIEEGHHGDLKLDGLNVALMAHADGNMKDGDWKIALYIDERADERQSQALQGIFSGAEGGHLANLGPLIGEVLGAAPARISYQGDRKRFSFEVAGIASAEVEAMVGQNEGTVEISGHPLAPVPGVPFTVGRSSGFRYADHGISCEVTQKNGFLASFAYQP